MPVRPAVRPLWAYGDGAAIVEPPEGKRALGFVTGERPPASWLNYQFHFTGATLDWLSGPDMSTWTRRAQGAVTFTAIIGMAQDKSANVFGSRYTLAVAGTDSTGAVMAVSRRGAGWSLRRNFDTTTGTLSGVLYALDKWWCWFDDGASGGTIMVTDPDGGSSSAVESNSNSWLTAYASAGTLLGARDLATDGTVLVAAFGKRIVTSVNGGLTWVTNSTAFDFGGGGFLRAVVYDGTSWVAIADTGRVWTATDPTSTWTHTATLSVESAWTWRLATDGAGTVVAYKAGYSATPQGVNVSTDHGASLASITLPGAMTHVERLYFGDGVWVAASSSAPYLWQSNDITTAGTWTALPLLSDDGSAWSAYDVILADGAWLAAGFTYTIRSGAARDVLAPVYGYDPSPGYLSDAGYLRGRRVDDTAPTNGQALVWSSASSRWVPGTASGGSSSPTTTPGDLIYRGASVDQRLAIGTPGQVLRVSAGAPAWGTLAASDVGAVAAPGSASTGDVLRWSGSAWAAYALAASDVGAVPTSCTITAGTGLTGGGDLSTGRTLAVSFGTNSSTACVGDDARLSDTRTPTDASVGLVKLDAAVTSLVETTVTLPIAPGMHAAPTAGSEIVGLVYFLPSRYAVSGLTTTISIEAVGYVEGGTLTLDVLDVTSGYTGATSVLGAAVTWTETDPTRKTASITLPGSGKIYAATISKSSSAGAYLAGLNLLVARS